MQKKLYLILYALIINLIISYPLLSGSPGTVSALLMVADIAARPSSLGGAIGALGDDINAIKYNPAGLCGINQYEFQFSHFASFEDINYESIMFGIPLLKYNSAVGISLDFLNYGDFEKRDIYGVDKGTFSADDMLLTFGYSRRLKNEIKIGGNIKYFSSKIEIEKADAMAIDVGTLYDVADNITLGLAFQNFGGKLKYINEEEDLPLNFKLSTKYSPKRFKNPPQMLFDINIPKGQKPNFNIGMEFWINEAISVRGGYKDKVDEGRFIGGVGFRSTVFQLDYAYMWADELDVSHRISALFRFGGDKNRNEYLKSKNKVLRKRPIRAGEYDFNSIESERNRRTIKFDDSELSDEVIFLTPMGTIK
ncbi:PorV/PorQ family protein [Candidatus Dependentiae bacterium]|nr:PorV/PorQ family protein [Candidatus Dependentiae bacterium]